jgi:hypothetical protein
VIAAKAHVDGRVRIPRGLGHRPAAVGGINYQLTEKSGPLVAVRSLCGGAGASTLAFLIAASAAREPNARSGAAPVLACDAAVSTCGLAAYAGTESMYSLDQLADALAAGRLDPRHVIASASPGLRIIATGLRPLQDGVKVGIERLLSDARSAHGLTVVDCGTLGSPTSRLAAANATHTISVFPATQVGLARAEHSLSQIAPGAAGAIVARASGAAGRAPMRKLARLAEKHEQALILMPQLGDLTECRLGEAIEACQVTLQAIAMLLRR